MDPIKLSEVTKEKVSQIQSALEERAKVDVELRAVLDKINEDFNNDRSTVKAAEVLKTCLLGNING